MLAHNTLVHSTTGDGNYCLTCGSDKTVKLWNPHTGLLLKTYVGHGQEVLDTDRYVGLGTQVNSASRTERAYHCMQCMTLYQLTQCVYHRIG